MQHGVAPVHVVWPGTTQVVHGDAPVAAGCAKVVCRWRPDGVQECLDRISTSKKKKSVKKAVLV